MNGKIWENCIQESCRKDNYFCKKLADGTSSWNRGDSQVRFQKSNECDFIIFNGDKLLLLEAKCHKGKSLPFQCIRESQIKGLTEKSKYDNVLCGILVLFSDIEQAYFIDIRVFNILKNLSNRQSISLNDLKQHGKLVNITKLRVRYYVDLADIFY